jgi:hypothetical protein
MQGLTPQEVEAKQGTPCPLCQGWDEKCQDEFHMRTIYRRHELLEVLDKHRHITETLLGINIESGPPWEFSLCLQQALHEANTALRVLSRLVTKLENGGQGAKWLTL